MTSSGVGFACFSVLAGVYALLYAVFLVRAWLVGAVRGS